MAHLVSFLSHVETLSPMSPAKKFATIHTDDHLALVDTIEGRDSAKVGPIDDTLTKSKRATITIPSVETVGMAIG